MKPRCKRKQLRQQNELLRQELNNTKRELEIAKFKPAYFKKLDMTMPDCEVYMSYASNHILLNIRFWSGLLGCGIESDVFDFNVERTCHNLKREIANSVLNSLNQSDLDFKVNEEYKRVMAEMSSF